MASDGWLAVEGSNRTIPYRTVDSTCGSTAVGFEPCTSTYRTLCQGLTLNIHCVLRPKRRCARMQADTISLKGLPSGRYTGVINLRERYHNCAIGLAECEKRVETSFAVKQTFVRMHSHILSHHHRYGSPYVIH